MIGHLLSNAEIYPRILMAASQLEGCGVVIVDESTGLPLPDFTPNSVTVTPTSEIRDVLRLTLSDNTAFDTIDLQIERDQMAKKQQRSGNTQHKPFYMTIPKRKRGRKRKPTKPK